MEKRISKVRALLTKNLIKTQALAKELATSIIQVFNSVYTLYKYTESARKIARHPAALPNFTHTPTTFFS